MTRLLARLILVLALGLTPLIAAAQQAAAPSFAQWERDAARAEEAVAAARASNAALEQLRLTIADWRTEFATAQTANEDRITTLKNQLTALGPAPAEGEAPEPEEILVRRKQLEFQLKRLQAPALTSVEAWNRADGIIRQIDGLIRERQADALMRLSPAPINPARWPATLTAVLDLGGDLWREVSGALSNPLRRSELLSNLPAILLMLAIAGALVWRGRFWVERLGARIESRTGQRWSGLLAVLLSLGQVILPVAGMMLLVSALTYTGLAGLKGGPILDSLPRAAFVFFAARWLGLQLFAPSTSAVPGFAGLGDRHAEGRFHVSTLGLLYAAEMLRTTTIGVMYVPGLDAIESNTAFPLIGLAGLVLFRIGQLLRRNARQVVQRSEGLAPLSQRLTGPLGTLVIGVGLLGPALGAVGYITAAMALIWPMLLTLGLVGLLIFLQGLIAAVWDVALTPWRDPRLPSEGSDWADRDQEPEADEATPARGEGLVPVLSGIVLTLAALPLLALIWGARRSDLAEIWERFLAGVTIGSTRISPSNFLTFAIVLVIGYTITRWVKSALATSILPKTRLDRGGQNAVVSGVGYLGIFASALAAITMAGIDLSSLAIVAGALSVGIGFGLQNIVSNFVSGIILLIERPISIGDMIEVDKQTGVVKAISVRSTRVETFDRTELILPNSNLISGVVTNLTRGNLSSRLIIKVGVDYASDTRHVERVLREIAEAQPMVMVSPPPNVFLVGLGADALQFEIRCIVADVNHKMSVASKINHEIMRRFREEGINIPFPQHDILLKNPEALREALGLAAAVPPPAGSS